ncbi:serine carboxypeptidase-like 18 [Olea europaea subsp. europaea]|uniref:Carboxypeptidase n=2 Tax=Olea europaea subsp. europaea TaxID=158383 RepID=A0A8S0VER0_OLEEU|nr:serine carboxypeptidase-like 18 [Olea europaea subsp. europaea]
MGLIIMKWIGLNALLLLLLLVKNGASESIIKTLPGYSGILPFKLETGYIGVGENDEVQLFYYFAESQNNPNTDPLLIWYTGGPGCTGLFSLIYESGPFTFDVANFDGSLPSILLNPYSWTKVANIIFLDLPVGTAFSYATTSRGYSSSDTKSAKDSYTFLRKWLLNHPTFIKNPLYVAGESYGGKLIPMVAMEILQGIIFSHKYNILHVNDRVPCKLKQGYIIGNGETVIISDYNSRIPYLHRMALISDEYFESAKTSCNENYYNHDPNNAQCLYALQQIEKCTENINLVHILEPNCEKFKASKPDDFGWDQSFSEDASVDHLILPTSRQDRQWCREHNYISCDVWANDPTVQEALHIRMGTIKDWKRCNLNISYEQNVESVLQYHEIFSKKGYEVLIFSGDHDMACPYVGTLKWIRMLNLTVEDNWRPWNVDGQVAGYTEKYKNNDFNLTFATVKGAGHTCAEYKPKECLAMLQRWISRRSL